MASPQMRSRIVGPVLAFVRSKGGDPAALVREFALPASAESDPEVILPLPALHAFLDAAERQIQDPFLGLHVATAYRRGIYGVMEFACRSAPTLREALVRIVRFSKLMNDLVMVSFEERDGTGTIEFRVPDNPHALGRHANEFVVATLLDQACLLSGQPCTIERAWFAHPRPRRIDELTAALGTSDIAFGADANGVSFSRAFLDLPVLTSDPPLLGVLDRHAEESLAQRPTAPDFVAQVRRSVRERMNGEAPSLEAIAGQLRMSPRTFQRRLTACGTTFQKLVESVREEIARAYVADPKKPLGEIAFLLGYAELSAFLRAFKRWTGKTPRQLRGG